MRKLGKTKRNRTMRGGVRWQDKVYGPTPNDFTNMRENEKETYIDNRWGEYRAVQDRIKLRLTDSTYLPKLVDNDNKIIKLVEEWIRINRPPPPESRQPESSRLPLESTDSYFSKPIGFDVSNEISAPPPPSLKSSDSYFLHLCTFKMPVYFFIYFNNIF